jgi:DNA-binding beta-propeller fold protein YncE
MIKRRFSPPRILFLALISIQVAGLACNLGRNTPPVTYSNVSAVGIGADAGEPFGIAITGGVIYVSDGASGVIKRFPTKGGPEIFARGFNTPSAIAFLPSGELIVADTGSHTIKKISDGGIVSVLAGVENRSGSDDGPVSSAAFNAPVGIAVADDGTIYIADTYNDSIRMIRDGGVSTIAGGQRGFADGVGTSASFDTPLGLAILGDKLLVADSGNARLRVVEKNGIVTTLTGGDDHDLRDGSLASARFVNPTAIAVDDRGAILIADGNAIRVIGRRVLPVVETLAGDARGYMNGDAQQSRFNRPSGLAIGADRALYVADSDNHVVRVISDHKNEPAREPAQLDEEPIPLATRWPFDPPTSPREIAGTLGEVRGDLKPDGKPVWFHNGLDIAGAYGETAKFIRDETVLDPHAAENFGTSRELLRLPLIGYIHLRLGRDKEDRAFGDPRFRFERDLRGKLIGIRVPRGARFTAGDSIGTLNSMNHVHLIAGRNGHEINALLALQMPGVADSIAPVIENVALYDADWNAVDMKPSSGGVELPNKSRIVVRAYDRMDGNSERRRLGVYRVGYQLLSNESSFGEIEWTIRFERSPSNESVRLAYAEGSRSGYTSDTIFNYIATNRVDGEAAREGILDTTTLPPGRYTLRVFAADYFGNVSSKDVGFVR